jgi:2-polyprenyl-6-methoxyphenol hydroxylase-like FAD-dependent oxidoreductase
MMQDVIIVGGGLGGAALAWKLACAGVCVLVFEKETEFRDRVRGEGLLPWGVNEARDLGIEDVLVEGCAHPIELWTSHVWSQRSERNLTETTPRAAPCLNLYHPAMQEVMLQAAGDAGADIRRGVEVKTVEPGSAPQVIVVANGHEKVHRARLIVGADGRGSRVRKWAGFDPWQAPGRMRVAGLLLDEAEVPLDSVHVFRNSPEGSGALFFPQRDGRVRAYAIRRSRPDQRPLSGKRNTDGFLDFLRKTGVPPEWISHARPAGPMAEFDGADTWVKHPYAEGVALIGDAASSNDPSWGNGLSLTVRDARVLSESLLEDDDWDSAAGSYASRHDEYFGAIHRITDWLSELLYEIGPEAEARREKAFGAMSDGRSRNPDFIALGPEAPNDEAARRRMFGES